MSNKEKQQVWENSNQSEQDKERSPFFNIYILVVLKDYLYLKFIWHAHDIYIFEAFYVASFGKCGNLYCYKLSFYDISCLHFETNLVFS